jgi:hypothetical protein
MSPMGFISSILPKIILSSSVFAVFGVFLNILVKLLTDGDNPYLSLVITKFMVIKVPGLLPILVCTVNGLVASAGLDNIIPSLIHSSLTLS